MSLSFICRLLTLVATIFSTEERTGAIPALLWEREQHSYDDKSGPIWIYIVHRVASFLHKIFKPYILPTQEGKQLELLS